MSILAKRVFAAAVVTVVVSYGVSTGLSGQATQGRSTAETEWRFFGSDIGATRYSPANQINASNVRNLQRRVALFDTELRSPAAGRDAGQSADRRRRDVHDGGSEPRRGGSRCGHRAAAVALAPHR